MCVEAESKYELHMIIIKKGGTGSIGRKKDVNLSRKSGTKMNVDVIYSRVVRGSDC
jgi:hypothetical protein